VTAWYATVVDSDLYLSTLVLGELRKGVELARAKDVEKSLALATRDERDVSGLGAMVLNPFRFGER
jgi:predicted nucleic acid-binding protein